MQTELFSLGHIAKSKQKNNYNLKRENECLGTNLIPISLTHNQRNERHLLEMKNNPFITWKM
jgi:hypothetical protein